MSDPTLTYRQLDELHETLTALRDEIARSNDWCETTPLGLIADADYDAITAAAKVVHRLALDLKFPTVSPECSYLPAPAALTPAPEPQSLRVGYRPESDDPGYMSGYTA